MKFVMNFCDEIHMLDIINLGLQIIPNYNVIVFLLHNFYWASFFGGRAEYDPDSDLLEEEFMLKGKWYHRKDIEVEFKDLCKGNFQINLDS